MDKYDKFLTFQMRQLWGLFTSPTVVTCSSKYPELDSSLSCFIFLFLQLCFLGSPLNTADTQVLVLTLNVWFRSSQTRAVGNRGTWYLTRTIFRLISYPSLHWTPHLLLVITCMPKLPCHTSTTHPCSFPQKSRIINLAFKDLHTWYWLPFPFSYSTPSPCVYFSYTVLPSTLQYAFQKFLPPCFYTNVSLCPQKAFEKLTSIITKPHLHCWKEFCFQLLDLFPILRVVIEDVDFSLDSSCWAVFKCDSVPTLAKWDREIHMEYMNIKLEYARKSFVQALWKNFTDNLSNISTFQIQVYVCGILLTWGLALFFWLPAENMVNTVKPP